MEAIAEGNHCVQQSLLLAVWELVPPCGRCDRCQQSLSIEDWSDKALDLLAALKLNKGIQVNSLSALLTSDKGKTQESWRWLARRLVQEELIRESNDGEQRLFVRESGIQFLNDPWPLKYAS